MEEAKALAEKAEQEDRDFTPEEQTQYDDNVSQSDVLLTRAERLEKISGLSSGLEQMVENRQAPAFNKIRLGDSEERAMAHYIRTGDAGGLNELPRFQRHHDEHHHQR